MKGIKITPEGEVSVFQGNFEQAQAEIGTDIIQYVPIIGNDFPELDMLCDEEGALKRSPQPNALASLLTGAHLHRQFIVGTAIVVSTEGAEGDEDWGDDLDLEVKVLSLTARLLKGAMLV